MNTNQQPQEPIIPNRKPHRESQFLIIFMPIMLILVGSYSILKLLHIALPIHHYLNIALILLMAILTIRAIYAVRHQHPSVNYLTSMFSLICILWVTLFTPIWMAILGLVIALTAILIQSYKNHLFPFRHSKSSLPIAVIDYILTLLPLLLILFRWILRLTA